MVAFHLSRLVLVLCTFLAFTSALPTTTNLTNIPSLAPGNTITWDSHTLVLNNRPTVLLAGEFHPFRLPSPSLWLDILHKMKANGYNAVTIYFNWAYHSPRPGVYDFEGVRDVGKVLKMASEVGLYVIARPGPYINAEVTRGGFPGWLINQAGRARTDASDYLSACDEWLTQINRIIAAHQYTSGTGSVILYQLENELAAVSAGYQKYMSHLRRKASSDGITVPFFHNDKKRNGYWVPPNAGVAGTVEGPVDLYGFDGYPGGGCRADATVGRLNVAPDWGIYGPGGATGGSSASPRTPGFIPEFGGGFFDFYGSKGTYECTSRRQGPGHVRVFLGTNLANSITMQSIYMTFGGTNWGWLAAPVVYTSYDYGAAISEGRIVREKGVANKLLGLFMQSVSEVGRIVKGVAVQPTNANVRIYHNVNVEDPSMHFYFAIHADSSRTTKETFKFGIETADGRYTVPQEGLLGINGQDAKWIVAGYNLANLRLVYSTSEIMTYTSNDNTNNNNVLVLHGRDGEDGETVFRFTPGSTTPPTVTVVTGLARTNYDASKGDLWLNYVHKGVHVLRISRGGGQRGSTTVIVSDNTAAATLWRVESNNGPVIVRGPALVRTATFGNAGEGGVLALTGDTTAPADLELWAPVAVTSVTWNGAAMATKTSGSGSIVATTQLPGPADVAVPDLSKAVWRAVKGGLESNPTFDDSTWLLADKKTTRSQTKPPAGAPVLTADDYGFHQGDVWYRGTFTTGSSAPGSTLSATFGGGGAGLLQLWIDGTFVGQHVISTGVPSPPTTDTASFAITNLTPGRHVVSIMVRNNGHNQDGAVNDAHKEGRGLIGVTIPGVAPSAITWKIQGNLGSETVVDLARGANNAGGLYGERVGWHLPGFPDVAWPRQSVPARTAAPGTSWYRTLFTFSPPPNHDVSLALTIGDEAAPQSTANYRALIFVNGWHVGQYVANVGPQKSFVLPNGILTAGQNTIALAVTSSGGVGNGIEKVVLTKVFAVRGGVSIENVKAPAYEELKDRLEKAVY
ncbi:beta-galactosidase [Powellomyces hirtus]|nr:beta-galactosidase [Powellomyces hirtus]